MQRKASGMRWAGLHALAVSLCLAGPLAYAAEGPSVTAIASESDAVALLYENDAHAVMMFSLEPGDSLPPHVGGHRAVYSMTDYILKYQEGGKTRTQLWKAGSIHWHESGLHAVENAGDTTAEFLVVACKTLEHVGGPQALDGERVDAVAPDHAKVILENDDVKVVHLRVPAGESIPEHAGYDRIVYSMNNYELAYTAGGETGDRAFEAGDVHSHEADVHTVENTGDTDAELLIFGWKR